MIKPDAVVTLAPLTYSQLPPSEWNIAAVHAPQVWNLGYSGQNTVVGVLDSGADPAHQDLVGQYRGGTNSWYDPYGQHLTKPYDASGHGTSVTSLIVGGSADGTGLGVAPGAKWIAARVFDDSGKGLTSSIHLAFQWMLNPDGNAATTDFPDVVNASWNIAGAIRRLQHRVPTRYPGAASQRDWHRVLGRQRRPQHRHQRQPRQQRRRFPGRRGGQHADGRQLLQPRPLGLRWLHLPGTRRPRRQR